MYNTYPEWNVWRDGSPGGELPADVTVRADRLIARLNTMHGNVALFSHGQFGASLAARWIGLPIINGRHFVFAHVIAEHSRPGSRRPSSACHCLVE